MVIDIRGEFNLVCVLFIGSLICFIDRIVIVGDSWVGCDILLEIDCGYWRDVYKIRCESVLFFLL